MATRRISAERNAALQAIVARGAGGDGPGMLLGVDAPLTGLSWRGAAGLFARGGRRQLRATDGFRIASMSKVFTATLVMQRVAQGTLALDARVSEFFPPELVRALHPRGRTITLEHLLNHTAGLWDFAMSRPWQRRLAAEGARFHAPEEILDWAVHNGEPVGAPGERYVYSDTGYVLLGHVLQRVTGTTYAALCREHILDPLGMAETWLEGHEPPRSTLSHCYAGGIDGLTVHGSIDWAAGGHVSTLADLDRFLRGLFEGGALVDAGTLTRMLRSVPADPHRYGLGISIRRARTTPPAGLDVKADVETLWGHGGFWGSGMFYVPARRATIVAMVNRTGQDNAWILDATLAALDA